MSLNQEQKTIVEKAKGKTVVLAGAGTGKTHTLIELLKRIVWRDKVPLNNIWITTFTNKAAYEIRDRLQKALSLKDEELEKLWIGTFHSLASRYLRRIAKINFGMLNDNEAFTMIKMICISEFDVSEQNARQAARYLQSVIGIKRSLDCTWKEAEGRLDQHQDNDGDDDEDYSDIPPAKEVFEFYQKEKAKYQQFDFDDLLEVFYAHIQKDEKIRRRFVWLINDEAQDNNAIQQKILGLIGQQNVVQVGDQKQSIYEWRGATPRLFAAYRDSADHKFTLNQNYRSSPEIITYVNALLQASDKFKAEELKTQNTASTIPGFYWTGINQARMVFNNIYAQVRKGAKPNEIAVLSRSVKGPDIYVLQTLLTQAQIPYEVRGGFDMVTSQFAQHYFSFLKGCCYPNRVNTFNALILFKGIKEIRANKIVDQVIAGKNPINNDTIDDYLKFVKVKNGPRKLAELSNYFLKYMWTYKTPAEKQSKTDIINYFIKTIKDYPSINSGIEALMLDANRKDETKRLVISTIHRSKGLEWDNVHLMNFHQGNMPSLHPTSDDEEFCLAYVACTRAKKTLNMYMPAATQRARVLFQPSDYLKTLVEHKNNCVKLNGITHEELFDERAYNHKVGSLVDMMQTEETGHDW